LADRSERWLEFLILPLQSVRTCGIVCNDLCPGGYRANGTASASFPLMSPLQGASRLPRDRQTTFPDPRDKRELRSPTPRIWSLPGAYIVSREWKSGLSKGVFTMTAPLTILLADDQVPWNTNAENERAKAEIRREYATARPLVDVDTAFADDRAWFTGLLNYLEKTKGETIIPARTFAEAKQRIENPRGLDVAIVDLSWWGDYTLPHGEPHRLNQGLKLIPTAGGGNRSNIPIVSLSQNFIDDFELMSTVYERGALPVPKNYQNPELGYRSLYAAVQYLTRGRRRGGSKVELFVSHAHGDKDLAQRLVTAIDAGLQVPSDAIRCTSVPGYDLPPGTDFIETLKDELTGALCVVCLWTPRSVKSQWSLFELGAAWGLSHKALFLSLGTDALRNPPAGFRSIQASQLSDAWQLRRFLDELARITAWPTKSRSAADDRLEALAEFAKRTVRK
jgi:hypothetical protein